MLRLYTDHALETKVNVQLSSAQSHYLSHVMRARENDMVLLFNGVDGEWQARIAQQKKQAVTLEILARNRAQDRLFPMRLIFAPIKRGHGDFAVEKAVECGATRLTPLLTQHTIVARVPIERYRAIAIEAAEQCGRLCIPTIDTPVKLADLLAGWNAHEPLILCAEQGQAAPLAHALSTIADGPLALLVGPEGGFSAEEFSLLRQQVYVVPAHLGPRILRADTAAIAALSIVQALRGDWQRMRDE